VRHHEVDDLADELLAQESGHEDVRVRQVHLLHAPGPGAPHAEPAAALVVQERGEHRRRVEPGQAQPVDVTVGGDEGGRVQVTDDAVVLDESSHVRLVRWSPRRAGPLLAGMPPGEATAGPERPA
jgi:hypothetical protein